MASSSRLSMLRERERLEGVKTWRMWDMRRHRRWLVYRFRPRNRAVQILPVWTSKLGAHPVRPDGDDEGHVVPSQSLRRGEIES